MDTVVGLLDATLSLRRLEGSGAEQAPEIVQALNDAGLRATHQSNPPGFAVYLSNLDGACGTPASPDAWLLRLMCGLDDNHDELERQFQAIRRPLLARRLAERFRALRPRADLAEALAQLDAAASQANEGARVATDDDDDSSARAEAALDALVRRAISAACQPMGATELLLTREWQRLLATHSSLANACLARFCESTGVHVQDATLITSPHPTRVRLSVLLYDRTVHEAQQRPRFFAWAPALRRLMREPDARQLSLAMSARLWLELRRQQYHPSDEFRASIEPVLLRWFQSCVTGHGGLRLRACLRPQTPVCLYLHGAAGSGKSSVVRALLPALSATVRAFLHPELLGAFVKQNLNKAVADLDLELQRRPNNNDLSVVHVVEMAREPLSASEPRLLLLGLEEMPDGASDAGGGTQLAVAALLAERFRKSSPHPDLLVCFTSNYPLCEEASAALRACKLFAPLECVTIQPVGGAQRVALGRAMLRSLIAEGLADGARAAPRRAAPSAASEQLLRIDVCLELGSGDVRPLVRFLRAVAAYAVAMLDAQLPAADERDGGPPAAKLAKRAAPSEAARAAHLTVADTDQAGADAAVDACPQAAASFSRPVCLTLEITDSPCADTLRLRPGPYGNLAASDGRRLDARTDQILSRVRAGITAPEGSGTVGSSPAEASGALESLGLILDLFLTNALAPAVVLCTDQPAARVLAAALIDALAAALPPPSVGGDSEGGGLGLIRHVDVNEVKMNRSLYDARDARSLRDEILDLREHLPRVAVELLAPTTASELLIREMVEDSPSVVAHSVHKRILHKRGLLFVVLTGAPSEHAISPELRSRASLVL